MFLAQTSPSLPAWLGAALPWLALAGLGVGLGLLVGVWSLRSSLKRLEASARRLEGLEPIQQSLERLAGERSDLDLRRVEHVLLELRDGGRRLEDALFAHQQAPRAHEVAEREPGAPASISERVINRLLALGYTRVRLITPLDELEALAAETEGGSGDVTVEARRDGALCKGRVLLRRGALTEVEIQPAYNVFP